jgi:hypothetical protein
VVSKDGRDEVGAPDVAQGRTKVAYLLYCFEIGFSTHLLIKCCGSGMFPDPDFYPSRISDLKKQPKRGVKKIVVIAF